MKELDAAEAERLVNAYSDLILRLSYTYLKSTQDGEDIVQTVLLKLLTGDRAFDSPEHEKAWVIRAAVNACKDELRAYRRRAAPLEDAEQAPAPEPPRSDVLDAVMELPEKYRTAIYLFYYEGYSAGHRGHYGPERDGGQRPYNPGTETITDNAGMQRIWTDELNRSTNRRWIPCVIPAKERSAS